METTEVEDILPLDSALMELEAIYQSVLDSYTTKDKTAPEQWQEIAALMNEKNKQLARIFYTVREQPSRDEINLDYKMGFEQLQKRIAEEADPVVKSSLVITAMHHIVYDLSSAEGNYYFLLNGKEEMQVLKKNIVYYINLSYKNEFNVYFHAFILQFALESLFNSHFYIGVDFEYTTKKIQLAQLNFEHNVALQSIIWMVSPNELEPAMMDNLVHLIVCNRFIKKILHGSDSLDIPYMYEHMLENDPEKIINFTQSMIDTRFLCEYYKINLPGSTEQRCSIYDSEADRSAIYYFGVISEQKQQDLADLLDAMPAPHDITWNIHKMPKSQVLYAQYDVIFLKYFYYRIVHVATRNEPTDLGKKAIMELYRCVLYELTQFVYLDKRGITFLVAKCKEEVDPINNYMVRKPMKILKLIDIFNEVSPGLVTADPRVEIDKVTRVNYYKGTVLVLIKKITYTILSRKCRIFKDKATIWTDKLDNQYVFEFFEKMNFNYLLRVFREVEKNLASRIKEIC